MLFGFRFINIVNQYMEHEHLDSFK